MIVSRLLLQLAVAAADAPGDSVYATGALREFLARAAVENRAPPLSLTGYAAKVESELAFILRDSLGRELVGQVEQLAANAQWERSGRYDLHVVGYRSQNLGAPYSALTFTRMWTVPTLYGNRLFLGMNDGVPRERRDTTAATRRAQRNAAAGREQYRTVHPLAADRDRYYRFRGGDTVAVLRVGARTIRIARVFVEPVLRPSSNFAAFKGELEFDADRHQLVRMRGQLLHVSTVRDPLLVRTTGAVAVAFLEFENVEVAERYWLPAVQRSEFVAQMGLLGDTRAIYRLVSRFGNYELRDSDALVGIDSAAPSQLPAADQLPSTRARLTFASRDSVSRYGDWQANLGATTASVSSADFDDIAPDVWQSSGSPRVDVFPRRMEDVMRYNRVEGLFTGAAVSVRFRDMAPGLSTRILAGWAWTQRTPRGGVSASLARGKWTHGSRAERTLASTNDFMLELESGLSIGPLISGQDDYDYVDRWTGAFATTRVLGHVDRAIVTCELAIVSDRAERTRLPHAFLRESSPFRPNRNAFTGTYARATTVVEYHPNVTGGSLSNGFGSRILLEFAAGELAWQRAEVRLAARRYWHGLVFASRVDAGAVFGSTLPPQVLYELGGGLDLPSYEYKEFGGDRAAIGRGLVAYHFPVMRTPRRVVGRVTIPGLSPGIGVGAQGGWADASTDAARLALVALGGDGVTPLSRPTDRIRATADVRITLLSGAIGFGVARPVDNSGRWEPFFVWGAGF